MPARGTRSPILVLLAAALCAAQGALTAALPAPARAQAPAVGAAACGHALSAPVAAKWRLTGGETGPLGCPTAEEAAIAPSPRGTTGREADFASGAILWHASGPRAGQTYAVTGCAYRLFFQYGGSSGWLGLPLEDAVNTPDGQHQAFEGGRVTFLRALDECSAERAAEIAPAAPAATETAAAETSPLDLFIDAALTDHITAAAAGTVSAALAAHYQRVGPQARVFTGPVPGSAPLKLYRDEASGDHVTVATAEGEREALAAGYHFEASQGFVWTDPHPGALALMQFRASADHLVLLAGPDITTKAEGAGLAFVRVEGYAPPP